MSQPKKQLTVGFVLDDSLDRPDGVQQYVLALGDWLSRRGHAVHYFASETDRRDIRHIHTLSGNVGVRFNGNTLRVPFSPASKQLVRSLLDSEQFDILHVQM